MKTTQQTRLLLLEDIPLDAILAESEVRKVLKSCEIKVVDTKAGFLEALDSFKPDIIVSDFHLPSFDGLTALNLVIENSPQTPVIILTGSMNEDVAVECMKAGAVDYVIKEHIKRLGRAVLNALEQKVTKAEKIEAEAALKISEERFRRLAENAQDLIYRYDLIPVRGFTYVSPVATQFTGFTTENHYADPDLVFKLVHPDDRHLIENLLKNTGEVKTTITLRWIRQDGVIIWTEQRINLIYNDQQKLIAIEGIARDITERKQAEEALGLSEERFRNLFENNLSVMLLIDPADGSIVDVNHSAEEYYGWQHDEFIKLKIQDINLHKEKINLGVDKAVKEKRIHFEFKHLMADGSVRDVEIFCSRVDINGKTLLHSIIFDITQRRLAEKQLMLLNRAMEQSPVSIIITSPEGDIEYVNPKFCEVTGYTFEEVSGKNPHILKSGQHSRAFYKGLWSTITTGREWRGELLDKKKNGDLYWQSTSISPIVDKTGTITHFLAVMEDITEKKKMINDLVAAKVKAEESDRLKTSFLHNISHEIRTPMNAIIGFSDMLKMPNLLPEKRQYFSQIVRDNSAQLLSIIDDIINVATIEAGREKAHEKETNINKLLLFIKTQYSLKVVPRKVSFTVTSDLSDDESIVRTDETKLLQILSNLVSNAIKFTQKGLIKVSCRLNGKFVEFNVEDTGIGIPAEMHEKIFDRFFQVDSGHNRTYGGTGLGLSIVKAYIKLLNGKIYLDSKPGKGTAFRFEIPYKPVAAKQVTLETTESTKNFNLPATVLIVDDELANFELLSEYLSKLDLTIIYAEDGLKAVKACQENPSISLVLMDVKMPLMDGYEASRRIKELRPQLPILIQTAYIYQNEREKSMMAYVDSFLKKPISQNTLLNALQKYLTVS